MVSLQVNVPDNLFDEMEAVWSSPDHPVFQLTSATFETLVADVYNSVGAPVITSDSFWDIYRDMKEGFVQLEDEVCDALQNDFNTSERVFEEELQLQFKTSPRNDEEVNNHLYEEEVNSLPQGDFDTSEEDEAEEEEKIYGNFSDSD
jgi:hypothetical protein